MKPAARYCSVLSSVIAALSLGCVDTEQTAGPRLLALEKSAGGTANACVEDKDHDKKGASVVILCAIPFPGTAVASVAKGWTDHEAKAYYVNDQTNKAVDIIDTRTYAFAGQVPGFVGTVTTYGGGTATTNGQGPNSMVPTHDGILWVSDGNSTVRVVDVHSQSIIASVSTAISACDSHTATTHYCGRVNEMTYDPDDQIVFVENPNPLDLAFCTTTGNNCTSTAAVAYPTATPQKTIAPYATFISAKPPYPILGTLSFPNAKGTTEAPVWDQKLHRFLVPVPTCSGTAGATACAASTGATQYIAVIDPGTMTVEKKYQIPDCAHLMPGITPAGTGMINDLSIDERDQHVLMPVCGKGNLVFDAQTGDVVNVVTEISSSDETWFNPGDGNFYVTAVAPGGAVPGPASARSLGVIDGKSGKWLQNVLDVGGNIGAALAETNRIFTTVAASTGTSACTPFGFAASGCVIVFEHEGKTDK